MDFEGLAELLIPLVFLAMVGGLVALRMLKPYGNRILELIREIQEERHQALSETRDLQVIRDRLDMLTERQDFLESLLHRRLEEEERQELDSLRRDELGSGPGAGRAPGDPSGPGTASGTGPGEGAGGPDGSVG